MTKKISFLGPFRFPLLLAFALALGCATGPNLTPQEATSKFVAEQTKGVAKGKELAKETAEEAAPAKGEQLPDRYQKTAYSLNKSAPVAQRAKNVEEKFVLPVGADISTPGGPQPLRVILKQIAALKNMNISWASDVDQNALVDVTIKADEDFFAAIDNLLRQLDYFHETEGNTIVVKYKETKKFHIAMPFTTTEYNTGVGGDVLGAAKGSSMKGTLEITSSKNNFDIWKNIRTNLDQVLEIWNAPAATAPLVAAPAANPAAAATTAVSALNAASGQAATVGQTPPAAAPAAPSAAVAGKPSGRGYYTVDQPIGLVTVTAPRSLLTKISTYFDNLKSELYRQITIEAKIVEVSLTSDNTTGLDWSSLLQDVSNSFLKLNMDFRNNGHGITIDPKGFDVFMDAIKSRGHVEILSNPKINVMNGQPAMISVGENRTYISSVKTTLSDSGASTTAVETSAIMSGLGMGVIASIMDDNEVILNLTPVTSQLTRLDQVTFGTGGNQVGLPTVSLREMNTMVRVKDGEMLIVGGLIDSNNTNSESEVEGLGRLPGGKKLFGKGGDITAKKELIILLRPTITPF